MLGYGGRCPWVMLVWAAMADLLIFSALVSSSQSLLVSADVAADGFVSEFTVDQWTMWRTNYLLHHFLFPLMLRRPFFLEAWLLVNKENQPLPIIIKLENLISLSWKCLLSAPRAPHQERRERWGFTWEPLFPLFLNYFELSDVILADMSLWIEWAGLLFGFGLNWWLKAISFHILTIVDHWVWRALAFSKFLGFWIWSAVDLKNGPLQYLKFIMKFF